MFIDVSTPLCLSLQGLNNARTLSTDSIHLLLNNLSAYMNCISLETSAAMWTSILNQFDTFFSRLAEILPIPCDMTSVLKIITCLLKVSGINNAKVCFTYLILFPIICYNCLQLTHLLINRGSYMSAHVY